MHLLRSLAWVLKKPLSRRYRLLVDARELDPVTAPAFRLVTGEVGRAEQLGRGNAVAPDRHNADARPDAVRLPAAGEPMIANGLPDLLRYAAGLRCTAMLEQYAELVAP